MQRVAAHRTSRLSTHHGAALLMFVLVGLPVMLFALGLSTDVARIIIAGREVGNATEAAAIAGAAQYTVVESTDPVTGRRVLQPGLDAVQAVQIARDTYCRAHTYAIRFSYPAESDGTRTSCSDVDVELTGPLTNPTGVKVTSYWAVPDILVASFFSTNENWVGPATSREASVCLPTPGSGATDGACVRPAN